MTRSTADPLDAGENFKLEKTVFILALFLISFSEPDSLLMCQVMKAMGYLV